MRAGYGTVLLSGAKGQGALDGANHDVVWLAIFLVFALVPAGRIAGLDNGLAGRFALLR